MELLSEVWAELLEIVQGLSTPVKVGWPLLFVWAMLQAVWFRHARVVPKVVPRMIPDSRRVTPRPRTGSKPAIPALRTGGSPEFLAALGLDQPSQPEPASTPGSGLGDGSVSPGLSSESESTERSAYTGRRNDDPPTGSTYR